MRMSKPEKKALVPALRFPEFRDKGAWIVKPLEKVCDVHNNRRQPISSNNREKGIYPYYGASGVVDYVKDYIFDERLLLVGEDGAKWGAFEKTAFIAEGKYWVNNHAHVLKPKEVIDTLLENYLVKLDISQYVTGAAPPKLTLGKLKEIPIVFPLSSGEQQKIADCLSSIDDLITAQTQKLAALKAHKKGLMQQLFPAEGETVPKLRFPEFRDAGEWESEQLGNIGKVSMCKRIMKHETSESGDIPFYKIGTFGKKADAYISKEIYDLYRENFSFPKAGDILISASGTIGRTVVFDGKPAYFQDSNIVWIDNDGSLVSNAFLVFIYQKIKWVTDDNTIARLYNDNLRKIEIIIPPTLEEQKKIADCLDSIDELITAQNQKIEALKSHKKGLMQQLFPSMDEVDG